jgi:hypothetical protein
MTLAQQLHNSATHKPGTDPNCPVCTKMNRHSCKSDDLVFRVHHWVEPHGEPCSQTWWKCRVCGWDYTGAEAAKLIVDEELRRAGEPPLSGE